MIRKAIKNILYYSGVILLSVIIAILLRLFVADFYSIPSDSMSPTLESGDFIMVNKLYFGARFYKNFDFLKGAKTETVRVPGYSNLTHNDVVVFNYPILTSRAKFDMDVNTFYIKRCIGLPGDTLSIVKGFYTINGKTGYGNLKEQQALSCYQGEFLPGIYYTFPFDRLKWNIVDFGPFYIPKKGQTIPLNLENLILYRGIIIHETDSIVNKKGENFYLGNSLITHYTFQKNWYFLVGDNIMNSRDCRYLGPIPEDFIIGKASLILTSQNTHTHKYNWQRFLKQIK